MSTAPKTKIEEVETGTDSELPEGWAVAHLCDIVNHVVDGSHNPPPKKASGVPMLSARNIEDGRIVFDDYRFISKQDFAVEDARTKVRPGDVLLKIGSIGRSAVVPHQAGSFALQRSVAALKPWGIDGEYLMYAFRSPFGQGFFEENGAGTAQKGVYLRTLSLMPVRVAPLSEQKRIVSSLDALLARRKNIEMRLARVSKAIQYFRQAVLAAACSGKLTEDWRQKNRSSETSDALLRRILQSRKQLLRDKCKEPKILSEPLEDYPETWTPATLDQLTWLITSGSRGWARYYSDSGADFIRAENINSDRLNISEIAHVKLPAAVEGSRTRVSLNDLLITITGANVTKSAVVDRELENAYVSQHVALVRPVDRDTSRFLYLWIVSPSHGRRKLLDDAYGAGKPGLNLDNIREMVVVLPPLQEQHEIARRVGALFKLADAIEKRVAAASARTEKLTQVILAKAFRGELVLTEAELARREGREYEPASVLLERIKKEGEKASANKERRKRTSSKA